jgi:oxygen-independent coproporphyrinogen-3 oxidase
MDPRLLLHAAESAPRYTSYPTAPNFTNSVTPALFKAWLGELDEHTELSLYLHVPYCREMCHYCACNTFAVARDSVLADYAQRLRREIDLAAQATSARRVREIHWGGGTPNTLSPREFERLVLRLDHWFGLDEVREHSIEVDPRVLTQQQAEMLGKLGINRASLGVQDLNAHVQRAMGRVQPLETVRAAVDVLRRNGVSKLNFDLMYGLPRQSVEDVRQTVRQAAELQPERIAVFGYAHVPWFKARQRRIAAADLPDTVTRILQAEAARDELLYAGYRAVGFDHFTLPDDALAGAAREGRLRRNFQGYVDDRCPALIGLGASAISTLPQGYAQNAGEPGAWSAAIDIGDFATVRGHGLTDEDRLRRSIIETLLCQFWVDLKQFGGATQFARELEAMAPLARDGLVTIDADKLVIPLQARHLARLVAKVFDTYGAHGAARHSQVS